MMKDLQKKILFVFDILANLADIVGIFKNMLLIVHYVFFLC